MASTFFSDYNQDTPIVSAWLNDVNNAVYGANGTPRTAVAAAAAWVRFSVTGGTVAIQQSTGIASVVRVSAGIYTITYSNPLTESTNCYEISANAPGFFSYLAETTQSVTVSISNTANVNTDPGSCCVMIFGG